MRGVLVGIIFLGVALALMPACGSNCSPSTCDSDDGISVESLCTNTDATVAGCTAGGQPLSSATWPINWLHPGEWLVIPLGPIRARLGTRNKIVVANDPLPSTPLVSPEVLVDGVAMSCTPNGTSQITCPNLPSSAMQVALRYGGSSPNHFYVHFESPPHPCTLCAV